VALAEFLRAVFEEANERPVDIAEAEEAEVEWADYVPRTGAEARFLFECWTRR